MSRKKERAEILQTLSQELMIEDLSETDRFDTIGLAEADKFNIIVIFESMGIFVSEQDFEDYPEISEFLDHALGLD